MKKYILKNVHSRRENAQTLESTVIANFLSYVVTLLCTMQREKYKWGNGLLMGRNRNTAKGRTPDWAVTLSVGTPQWVSFFGQRRI